MDNIDALIIRKPGYYQKILKNEIMYIKKDYRRVIIELENSSVSLYGDKTFLKDIDFKEFFLVHNGLIVNLEKIIKMANSHIYFKGGKNLKIGVNNFRKVLKKM